jgi:hypothetical protein
MANDLGPLRDSDGQPLEAGTSLLQDLTSGLETCPDLAEARKFASHVEPEVLGLKRCVKCNQIREVSYFALDTSKPSSHSDVCVACNQPEAWESVQKLKSELASLPPDEREQRFIERGKELGLLKDAAPNHRFPAEYRGVSLDDDERDVIAGYLETWLGGNIPQEAKAQLEYLYVADALFFYARKVIKQAQEKRSPDLARAGCATAEKGMAVARGECFFVYEFARCLDTAGFTNATDYYRLFLEQSTMNPGARGYSPAHVDDFRRAILHASERLNIK